MAFSLQSAVPHSGGGVRQSTNVKMSRAKSRPSSRLMAGGVSSGDSIPASRRSSSLKSSSRAIFVHRTEFAPARTARYPRRIRLSVRYGNSSSRRSFSARGSLSTSSAFRAASSSTLARTLSSAATRSPSANCSSACRFSAIGEYRMYR